MSRVRANTVTDFAGTGTPSLPYGIQVGTGATVRGSTNTINLLTNGSERLRVRDNGRLMTGAEGYVYTASSSGSLSLYGGNSNLGAGISFSGGNSDADIKFYAQASTATPAERLRIDSSGRVLIGTTTEGNGSADNLTVADAANCGVTIRSGTTNYGSIYFSDATSGAGEYDGYIQYSQNTQYLSFGVAQVERLRITSSGNIGIGDDNPARNLVVKASGQSDILIESGNSNYSQLIFGDSDTEFRGSVSYNHNGDTMQLYTAGLERLRIDSSGQVILNNSASSGDATVLRITGGTNGSSIIEMGDTADTDIGQIAYYQSSNAMAFRVNASEQMRIDSSGRLLIGTDTAGTTAADDLTLSTSGNTGITIRSGTSNSGTLIFANGTSGSASYRAEITYSHSSNAMSFTTSGGFERMRIDSSGRLLLGGSTAQTNVEVANNVINSIFQTFSSGSQYSGPSILSYSAGDYNPVLSLGVSNSNTIGTNTLVGANWDLGMINFVGNDGTNFETAALISSFADGTPAAGSMPGALRFSLTPSGSTVPIERMRITNEGYVRINRTTSLFTEQFVVQSDASTVNPMSVHNTNSSAASDYSIIFGRNGNIVGSVQTSLTATTYVTSSDYRLKENVVDISGAIDRVKQLSPKRFNFIADPTTIVDGFLAHEAQTIVPEAVTGEKDGEEMQGIDQSKLVPLLTASIKELIAEVDTLKAKVAALEAG